MTLSLFPTGRNTPANLLPYDGSVNDYGAVIAAEKADVYFSVLAQEILWRHDEVLMYGKRITTARQTAWYGDKPFAYTYSGISRLALPWHSVLLEIKQTVEDCIRPHTPAVFNSCLLNLYSGITRRALPWHPALLVIKETVEQRIRPYSPAVFNTCLLNLYSDGREGMAWHSDDERELGKQAVIASVSFGATRKFAFKHKHTQEKREMLLQHGQLIVMHGSTQTYWRHAVMKSAAVHEPRISLTFRTILD